MRIWESPQTRHPSDAGQWTGARNPKKERVRTKSRAAPRGDVPECPRYLNTVFGKSGEMVRRSPIPVSFAIVVSVIIALFIFFGAWAVSVDAANHDRELSFAVGNTGSSFDVNPFPSQKNDRVTSSATTDSLSSADSWWGRSLLFACPLH